ncbi:autotransporter-associated beta strand repeat-containing protein, partial [Rhizobiaceae sp. 2RAB30]
LNDLIDLGGDLVLDGRLDVQTSSGGSFDPGVYRVINYGGTLTDRGLVLGTVPSPEFYVQTSISGQINLVNTAGMTLRYWDGETTPARNNGVIEGGNGLWQNFAGNENWTEETGASNAPFNDRSFAIFAGSAGTVTVDDSLGAINASGMQFLTDGYVVRGDAINLAGSPSSVIRVGDGTSGGVATTATIASELRGATQLVKSDMGTLILTGRNSYSGGTAFNGGTLQIAADGNLGAASGALSFDGGTLRTTSDITTARAVTLKSAGTLRTDGGTMLNLETAISGTGSLTKDGAGSLLLLEDASHSGGTRIAGGTLRLGNGGEKGGVTGDIVNDGMLVVERSNGLTLDGVISGKGSLIQAGRGTTILAGLNSYKGSTTVRGGTLRINGDQSVATGATTVGRGATLGGGGTIGGDVSIADGASLEPGGSSG